MFSRILLSVSAIASLNMAVPVLAQAKPVELTSSVQLVQKTGEGAAAQQKLVVPTSVVPGDTLVFATGYHNSGGAPVKDFVIVNPVPASVLVTPESAAALEVSIDGGKNWGQLAALSVPVEGGQTRPAANTDITHIRWTVATLQPGETGAASYRATVR